MRVLILMFRLFQNNYHVEDGVKYKFGFQNANADFKIQMRVLILTFCLFQNNLHVDDTVKLGSNTHLALQTHVWFFKHTFGFSKHKSLEFF